MDIKSIIYERASIDRRTLAFFRISISLMVIINLIDRLPYFKAFLTNEGVLPIPYLKSKGTLYSLNTDPSFIALLFFITFLFALSLLIGYRSRLSSFLLFLLMYSLVSYENLTSNLGTMILIISLFISIFLPVGSKWSIDSLIYKDLYDSNKICNYATFSSMMFVISIYIENMIVKYQSEFWMSGIAIKEVLETDRYSTIFGNYITQIPEITIIMNWLWVILLTISPFLIIFKSWKRFYLMTFFMFFHLGIFLSVPIGVFPLISISVLTLFIPSEFWDKIDDKIKKIENKKFSERISKYLWTRKLVKNKDLIKQREILNYLIIILIIFNLLNPIIYLGGLLIEDNGDKSELNWTVFALDSKERVDSDSKEVLDDWVLAHSTLKSGRKVELFFLTDNKIDSPPTEKGSYLSNRWKKYLDSIEKDETKLKSLADYLCDRGKKHYGELPQNVSIQKYVEKNNNINRTILINENCKN